MSGSRKFWRVAWDIDDDRAPPSTFQMPPPLLQQRRAPRRGDAVTLAAYDDEAKTGLLRWLGIVGEASESGHAVEWQPSDAQIWVDSAAGRGFWKAGAFGFADAKIVDYGLNELWGGAFDNFEAFVPTRQARATSGAGSAPHRLVVRRSRHADRLTPERTIPREVIGEPVAGPHAGVVYVLQSAYGYKVGRTNNVPARMRAFGVHLPFIYSILFCAWFADCHAAEHRYHQMFSGKRINGEWFDLSDADIACIRSRL